MEMLDWFEWNGVRCTEYGMHVLNLPPPARPSERMETEAVPGRAGELTLKEGEDVYDPMTLSCTCVIDEPYYEKDDLSGEKRTVSRVAEISGWLRGRGTIKFANRQEGFYRGRVSNEVSFSKIVRGNPHMQFEIQFWVEPFLYLDSGLEAKTISITDLESSTATLRLENYGNVPSEPLLKVIGTGEGTIMSGQNTMLVDGLDTLDYLMLDCEQKVAYKGETNNPEDPLVLLGTRVTGEWLKIPIGESFFTIEGDIKSVEIVPRWRCI